MTAQERCLVAVDSEEIDIPMFLSAGQFLYFSLIFGSVHDSGMVQ
jgi:hypothetical protein